MNSMNRNSREKLFKEFNLANNKHPIKTMRYHFAHQILKILMMKFSWKWTICKQLLEKHIDIELKRILSNMLKVCRNVSKTDRLSVFQKFCFSEYF